MPPEPRKPLFDADRGEASDAAARALEKVFRAMVARGVTWNIARRFALQQAVALLATDTGVVLRGPLATMDPVAPTPGELALVARATREGGARIHPGILGTLFQVTMSEGERHEHGAHYTPEAAIFEHVVRPSLVEPWRARIRRASTPAELHALRGALDRVRILDPACGCGSFLHVASRALEILELELLEELRDRLPAGPRPEMDETTRGRTCRLFGIDKDPLAVELARVTLLLGSRRALPPEDVDVRCDDALFCAWPAADVILGNPPFQSKNKMQEELGAGYVRRLRERYPRVPGRADYCVYWLHRAHDELGPGARAGFVGTNTIRQNSSREGGLDHIVENGGTLTEAVSTMVWPGQAVVHVSVVNWIKDALPGPKKLSWQATDARDRPWSEVTLERIPSSLSAGVDVTGASALRANAEAGACYQGQTHGHAGFLLETAEARAMCAASPENAEVIFPHLIGEELLTAPRSAPTRWVIDFHPRGEREARRYPLPFRRIEALVLPDREEAAARERRRNEALQASTGTKGNRHHEAFRRRWWLLDYPRGELMTRLRSLGRYIACSRVTKRPIFELVSTAVRPGDALVVFPLEDDYSFGILQSSAHWLWFKGRCSTLTAHCRYTSETVFDSFPWPQSPDAGQVAAVAEAAVALRARRRALAAGPRSSLRALYASMEEAGEHPLKDAHAALDAAVRAAYAMGPRQDPLELLLDLNRACAAHEAEARAIVGPGVPPGMARAGLVTRDAVEAPELRADPETSALEEG